MKRFVVLSVFSVLSVIGIRAQTATIPAPPQTTPRVYLTSKSNGNTWAVYRSQDMEMSKDFAKDCPSITVTLNAEAADYTVLLNHLEVGLFLLNNQFQVTNKVGDVLASLEEGHSINHGVKGACRIILENWNRAAK